MSDRPSDIEGSASNLEDDILILKADIAALAQQMKELIEAQQSHHPVSGVASTLTERASGVYETISESGKNRLDEVSAYVKAQPIQSILLSAAAGLILSKTLFR